jgi:hypothetical protein
VRQREIIDRIDAIASADKSESIGRQIAEDYAIDWRAGAWSHISGWLPEIQSLCGLLRVHLDEPEIDGDHTSRVDLHGTRVTVGYNTAPADINGDGSPIPPDVEILQVYIGGNDCTNLMLEVAEDDLKSALIADLEHDAAESRAEAQADALELDRLVEGVA